MNDTPGKMLSSLTGGDKHQQHPKLGGCVGVFFQMFDWNKRFTGKKLFSNRLLPAERPKQVSKKYTDEKLPMAKLLLIADENRGGFPNTKKNSSSVCPTSESVHCSSSKEGNGNNTKAPSVVARLMGLESLPPTELPELAKDANTKPSEPRPLPELMNQRKYSDFFHDEQLGQFASGKHHAKMNELIKRSVESRPQKLQKTGLFEKRPVSKFQPDTLPFKSILSPSKSHNKLVSPIKSPGLLSAKNAARLMEAAAKILEPGMQTNNRAKNPLIRSSVAHPLLKDQEADERRTTSKRLSRVQEPLRKSVDSNAIKLLKGQALSKSWNGKEDTENSKPTLDQNSRKYISPARENSGSVIQDTGKRKSKPSTSSAKQDGTGVTSRVQTKLGTSISTQAKKQERTISLALEAKANVQRRGFEPLNASSSNACNLRNKKSFKEEQIISNEQQQSVQENGRKNDQKQCTSGIPRVAKQNLSVCTSKPSNQLTSREKVLGKNDWCNEQANKGSSGESSSRHIHRNLQGTKDSTLPNRIATGNFRSNNNNSRNFGSRKHGCKDKEDRKKTELKKSDSSFVAKVSPTKKRLSDGHFMSDNTCVMESVSEDESNFLERNEKKGRAKNVKEMLLKGKGSSGNYSKQQFLETVENVEGSKRGQQNAQKESLSCSKSMDVVSFTFSSPMRSTGKSRTGMHMMEKKLSQGEPFDDCKERQTAHWRDPRVSCQPEKVISEVPCSGSSSTKPVIPGGDTLNALLEQKLRELTSSGGADLSTANFSKDSVSNKTTASILQDLILALNMGRLAGTDQNTDLLIGSNNLNEAAGTSFFSEASSETYQVKDKERDFAANGEATSILGANHVPHRSRVALADVEDSGGAVVCGEDCDQPSPVSILEFSFSNESCNSVEGSDATYDDKLQPSCSSVESRTAQVCLTDRHFELDSEAELCDSASSANLELVESDKIMDAILDISRLHKIDPSLIGLEKAEPACLEDQELDYVREIICNAELMSEDVGLLSEEDVPDFLVDPNVFDKLETQESSYGDHSSNHLKNSSCNFSFRKAQGSWLNKRLLFDCVKECLCSKYSSRYKGGYRTWIKGPTCLECEKLAGDVLEEIGKWRMMVSGMLDDIVEKDMSTTTGKWTDLEKEIFEIGAQLEKNIFTDLIEELTSDLFDTALT